MEGLRNRGSHLLDISIGRHSTRATVSDGRDKKERKKRGERPTRKDFHVALAFMLAYAPSPNSSRTNFLNVAEYHRFLRWFSDLLPLKLRLDISTQRFPISAWPFQSFMSCLRCGRRGCGGGEEKKSSGEFELGARRSCPGREEETTKLTSSLLNGSWHSAGFRWFTHRSLHCLPTRPGSRRASSLHLVYGSSFDDLTASRTMASS